MDSTSRLNARAASLLPGLALALAGLPALAAGPCPPGYTLQAQVGGQGFRLELAANDAARARGLSHRAGLPADAGMWFVMPAPGKHGFWMKDMAFPIDLVWIGDDLTVLGAVRLEPCGAYACPVHYPPAPVSYVLEVNAGAFAGKPGDRAAWGCARDPED